MMIGFASWLTCAAAWANDPNTLAISATISHPASTTNALPTISINGRPVLTIEQDITLRKEAVLPEALKSPKFRHIMAKRKLITPYTHNPARGDVDALVTVIEMVDLSCAQCLPFLKTLDTWIAEQEVPVRHVHVYMPVDQYNTANPAAFYSKVAQYQNQFWAYRTALTEMASVAPELYFQLLMQLDIPRAEARLAAQRHARQYYKELDADSLIARKLKLNNPPHFFINGIHVGEGGVPLEHLTDVLTFELKSRQAEQAVNP